MKHNKGMIFVTIIFAIIFATSTVLASPGIMVHWANIRDDKGDYLYTVYQGEEVEILGTSQSDPTRTDIVYNGIYGSVCTAYVSHIPVSQGSKKTEEISYNEIIFEDNTSSYLTLSNQISDTELFPSTGIFSKVTANLCIRDSNYHIIGSVPKGAMVEVLQISLKYPERMEINYNGIQGSVLACYIEHTYADNDHSEFFEDNPIKETFVSTGIFSRVTADLCIRDSNYQLIGGVPKGALVEVLQFSHRYPERMEINYNGIQGSVLACYIEHTYADNLLD